MKTVQILNDADEVIASFTESFFRLSVQVFHWPSAAVLYGHERVQVFHWPPARCFWFCAF